MPIGFLGRSLLNWIRSRPPAAPIVILAAGTAALAATWGAPVGRTGAPPLGPVSGELTCAIHACHEGNPTDQGGALRILGVPAVYVPGAVYPITVALSSVQTESFPDRRWGFEVTAARLADGRGAGSFAAPGLRVLVGSDSRVYVTHDPAALDPGGASPASWNLQWTAPAGDEGPVGFYAAGTAADGNGLASGDWVYIAGDTALAPPVAWRRVTWGAIKSGRLLAAVR
jgi:hypothetical protein